MSVSFSSGDGLKKMIEQYNQELLRTYQRSALSQKPFTPKPPTEATAPAEAVVPAAIHNPSDDNAPCEDAPSKQEDGPPAEEESGDTPSEENAGQPEDDLGRLQIRVFSASSAIPIADAYVTVSRDTPDGEELVMVTTTDRSGFTPLIELPTVARELSLQPGEPHPYTAYNILVHVAGFYTVRDRVVPVYSGITSVQPVELIPLPEGVREEEEITYTEGAPTEL